MEKSSGGDILGAGDFVPLGGCGEPVVGGLGAGERAFVGANVDGGTQLKAGVVAAQQRVADKGGVLAVDHAGALFELEGGAAVGPDGQAVFEAELSEGGAHEVLLGGCGDVFGDQLVGNAVDGESLFKLVEHHGAAMRGGQRGDEPAVEAPCVEPGECAGGVAADAIGEDPLVVKAAGDAIFVIKSVDFELDGSGKYGKAGDRH